MTVREAHDILSRRLGDPVEGLPNDTFVRDGTKFSAAMRNQWLYEAMVNVVNKTISKTIDNFASLSVSPYTRSRVIAESLEGLLPRMIYSGKCSTITATSNYIYHVTYTSFNSSPTSVQADFTDGKGTHIGYPMYLSVLDGSSLTDTVNVDFSQRIPLVTSTEFSLLTGNMAYNDTPVLRPNPIASILSSDITEGTGNKITRMQLYSGLGTIFKDKRIFLHYIRMPRVPAYLVGAELDLQLDIDERLVSMVIQYATLYGNIEDSEQPENLWSLTLN